MAGLVGLVVNPVAGMGGRVGLHGTDGPELLAEARRRGAAPVTASRAARALRRLAAHRGVRLLAAPASMGADVVAAVGGEAELLDLALGDVTSGVDTTGAAAMLAAAGVDLVLFAGGDGTAADVVRGTGTSVPILGVPSGVKMRSGVFAAGADLAGDLAGEFLAREVRAVAPAEIVDVSDAASPLGALVAMAVVPDLGDGRLLGAKSSAAAGSAAELDALCAAVAGELVPGRLYLFGPGGTTGKILEHLGLAATPLGVDAARDGRLLQADASERELLALVAASPDAALVLGVIGGQGVLLGRGNQQLSAAVLARLSPGALMIVASARKLAALGAPVVWADLGGEDVPWLGGYHRVRVAPARYQIVRVVLTR